MQLERAYLFVLFYHGLAFSCICSATAETSKNICIDDNDVVIDCLCLFLIDKLVRVRRACNVSSYFLNIYILQARLVWMSTTATVLITLSLSAILMIRRTHDTYTENNRIVHAVLLVIEQQNTSMPCKMSKTKTFKNIANSFFDFFFRKWILKISASKRWRR